MRKLARAVALPALLALAPIAVGEEPAAGANQRLADSLARTVRANPALHGYAIDIEADGGVVTLSGTVGDEAQRAEALQAARGVAGVVAVRDRISAERGVVPVGFAGDKAVSGQIPAPAAKAVDPPKGRFDAVAPGTNGKLGGPPPGWTPPWGPWSPPGGGPGGPPGGPPGFAPGAVPPGFPPGAVPNPPGPQPEHSFPGGLAPYSDAPVVPPYAWPAYTPYNNYASMAYQTQYPSGAWPFIGPPHPYPMIPSGWRSVNLRWRRGYWYLRFNAF